MAWTCTFQRDDDKPKVGTAVAKNGDFTFSGRVNARTMVSARRFIIKAKAAKVRYDARQAASITIGNQLATELNK